MPLRLLADENIPQADVAFRPFGEVDLCAGETITQGDLAATDVLLVRSVTTVTQDLVGGTPVRFVGSATAGTDHVDRQALANLNISFAHAPGSNADSVVDYVLAGLLAMAADRGEALSGRTLGIVGVGAIGRRLAVRAQAMGLTPLLCDPPRADRAEAMGETHPFVPLETVLHKSDLLSLHTPLTYPEETPYPTYHLIGEKELSLMKPGAWLLNTARGAVVDGAALLTAVSAGSLGALMLDVWENEPSPDLRLVLAADLATPHVAGYALDGKLRGTQRLAQALAVWYARQTEGAVVPGELQRPPPPLLEFPVIATSVLNSNPGHVRYLDALARQVVDIRGDDARFRRAMHAAVGLQGRGEAFRHLRATYPERRELSVAHWEAQPPEALSLSVGVGLGIQMRSGERAASSR